MEGDLPAQANAVNVGSSILEGASLPVISGGEFNSSEGDHNRITINIHQGVQRPRDDRHESSSTLHQGQRNLRRDHMISRDLSDVQDEECIEEQSSNEIYERQMLPKKRGSFPLWVPQPNTRAFLTHRREGVTIGDLGRVTAYGAFDVLFNICKAGGHPDNPDELPDGFEPLVLRESDIHRFQEYPMDSCIASASVKKLSGLTFRCSSSEGAVLTMPDGAFREDLQNITLFRDFAAENAENWYRFANGPCGRDIGNGKLHLITGCDKTSSWGLAAYQNIQSQSHSPDNLGEPLLRFRNTSDFRDRISRTTYCWEHEGTAEVKAGPEFQVDEDMPDGEARAWNQCTFIRSHTIKLSEAGWARVQSTLVSALDTRRASSSQPARPESASSSNLLTNPFSHLGIFNSRQKTRSATTIDPHACPPVIHPSTLIADILLQKHPDAKVAIVHDDHWGILVRQNEDRMPTGAALWKRVEETFDIVLDCKGTIYLSESISPKHAPQFPNDLAHAPVDHRPIMATSIVDAPNLKGETLCLDGQVEIAGRFPFACGGYADIYPGILRGGYAGIYPWILLGGQNISVAVKVFRDVHNGAPTREAQREYLKILEIQHFSKWALLQHPNILPLFGLVNDPAIPSIGIVTPRCTFNDLRCFFSDPTRASKANRLEIVKGIARGLSYLHEKDLVHGDMTMNHVLFDVLYGKPTPILSIFGHSRVLEQVGYTSSIGAAVHRHFPPEVLTAENDDRSKKALTQTADVWCFGMVMLETLTGKQPFYGLNELQAGMAVAYRKEKPNRKLYPSFPHESSCWEIMERCWHHEPSQRAEMHCLLQLLDAVL